MQTTDHEGTQRNRRLARLAWAACAVVVIGAVAQLAFWASRLSARPTLFELVEALGWGLAIPIVFAVLAALIIARQPGNRVGWLMIIVALTTSNPVSILLENHLSAPPQAISAGLWILLWLDGWSWIPVIFPIFLIPLHFPTGRPPSSRWNWVIWLAFGMWVFFVVSTSFLDDIGPINEDWRLPNPIGFLPSEVWNGPVLILWGIGLLTVLSASVLSLFLRYRRAQSTERTQIKWLLFAGAFFVVFYALTYFLSGLDDAWLDDSLNNLLFVLSILAFPTAIAIAILRYRLYDIDVIIRKTLVYAALTGLLAMVYFGSIAVLQGVFTAVSGQSSAVVIVVSTLAIAALFTPLRRRIQDAIDHRFYRRKYDAEQVLAQFSQTVRQETDLDNLTAELAQVVQETMQPERVSIWLRKQ